MPAAGAQAQELFADDWERGTLLSTNDSRFAWDTYVSPVAQNSMAASTPEVCCFPAS